MLQDIQKHIEEIPEQTVGKIATAIGTSGITLQYITDAFNLILAIGNVFLLAGGLYLMFHKIRESKRRDRRATD